MSEWGLTGREYIERLIEIGWTDDQIIEGFARQVPPFLELPGHELFWLNSPRDTRRLRARLAEIRAARPVVKIEVPVDIARNYRALVAAGNRRPSQSQVANRMGFTTDQPVRMRLRKAGIVDWRHVHDLIDDT
jgi:hypothetical protein